MPLPAHYISSVLNSFSTFLDQSQIAVGDKKEARQLLQAILAKKNDSSSWSLHDVNSFVSEHPDYKPGVIGFVSDFIHRFPPHQISVYLQQFLLALSDDGCSHSTIKNYRSDINQFWNFAQTNQLSQLLNKTLMAKFVANEKAKGLQVSSIRRKVAAICQFGLWSRRMRLIETDIDWMANPKLLEELQQPIATSFSKKLSEMSHVGINHQAAAPINVLPSPLSHTHQTIEPAATAGQSNPPVTGPTQPQDNSPQIKGKLDLVSQKIRTQSQTLIAPWLTFAAIGLFFIGLAIFGYQQLISETPRPLAYPTTPVTPNRVLSFQGRLTDTAQNPITTATNMSFKLFDAATVGTELWSSGTCSVTPDQDGIFNTALGSTCGSAIPSSVFSERSNVWLEVTIAAETLTPRQPIWTVPYALNSETLQGYPINATGAATVNTVLTMDSSGDVVLGEVGPEIRSVSGQFSLTGQSLLLQTQNNGNIILDANGTGGTFIRDYLSAPAATFSATYAGGTPLTVRGGPSGTADLFSLQNNAGTALSVFDEAGNLGIGTTNPSNKLHVDSGIVSEAAYFTSGAGTNTGNATVIVNQTGYDSGIKNTVTTGSGARNANIYGITTNVTAATLGTGGANDYEYAAGNFAITHTGSPANAKNVFGIKSVATANNANFTAYGGYFSGASSSGTAYGLYSAAGRNYFSGNTGIGTTNPASLLSVGATSQFQVNSSGAIAAATGITSSGTITLSGLSVAGGVVYTDGAGVLASLAGSSGECLTSNGASAPSWGSCATGSTNYWRLNNGAFSPVNDTADLLIGSQASSSAKFAFLNVNSGTPTASIAGTTTGAAVSLDGEGTLTTSNSRSLLINPTSGNVGIGTTNATKALSVNGIVKIGNFTEGYTTGYGLIVNSAIKATEYNLRPPSVGDAGFTGFKSGDSGGSNISLWSAGAEIGYIDGYGNSTDPVLQLTGGAFNPSSGTGIKRYINLVPTFNTTGTYNGGVVGIDYNPTNTSLVGTHYAALFRSGLVGVGTTAPTAALQVNGSYGANDALTINQLNSGNILTASASGTTRFTLSNNGNIVAAGSISGLTGVTSSGTITFSGLSDGIVKATSGILSGGNTVSLTSDVTGVLPLANGGTNKNMTAVNGGVVYTDADSLEVSAAGTLGECLISGGAGTPTWGSCSSSATNYWRLSNGAFSPVNDTADLLIGSQASTSAKFAFLNVNSGSPTASIAGTTTGAAVSISGEGTITTSNNRPLLINPNGGYVGIGTTAAASVLHVRGPGTDGGGTVKLFDDTPNGRAVNLTRSGTTTTLQGFRTDLVFDTWQNSGDRYVRVQNSGGYLAHFTVTGNTGIGTTSPTAQLHVLGKYSNNDALTVNQTNSGNILTASSSGTTRFTLANNGNIVAGGAISGLTGVTSSGTITFSGLSDGLVKATSGILSGGNTVSLTSDVTGILPLANGGTNKNMTAVNGGIVYTDADSQEVSAAGTLGECLISGGAGTPTWGSCGSANYWRLNNGAFSPVNDTTDLLIGSQASSSAKFAFLNVNSGTPTASIAGSISGAAISVDGDGTLATSNNRSLLLNPSNGNVGIGTTNARYKLTVVGGVTSLASGQWLNFGNAGILYGDGTTTTIDSPNGSGVLKFQTAGSERGRVNNIGNFGIGTSSPTAQLHVLGKFSNNDALTVNQTNSGNIFSASASGTTRFTLANNGSIVASGPISGLTGVTSSGTITFSGLSVAGGVVYTDGAGILSSVAGSSGQCLISSGSSAPSWGDCDNAALASKWNISNGAYSQINTTADLLIGGTASTSAKFAFLNVNSGVPTASIAGTTTGAAVSITGEGTIETTRNRSLLINPTGGNVGIGTTTPAAKLALNGNFLFNSNSQNSESSLLSRSIHSDGRWAVDMKANNSSGAKQVLSVYNSDVQFGYGGEGNVLGGVIGAGNSGYAYIPRLRISNSTGGPNNASALIIDRSSSTEWLTGGSYPSGSNYYSITTFLGSPLAAVRAPLRIGGYDLSFWTGDTDTRRMTIATAGNIGVGTTTPTAQFQINGAYGSNDALTVNQLNSGNILTASASGTTRFTIANNGDIVAGGAISGLTGVASSGTITFSGLSDGIVKATSGILSGGNSVNLASEVSGVLALANGGTNKNMTAVNGGIVYTDADSQEVSAAGTLGECLISGGAGTPTWGSCAAGSTNYWRLSNGAFSTVNDTADLLIGSQASSSAKFAFLNVNSGTPTASIAGSISGAALRLSGDGTIDTTNNRSLLLNPTGGNIGIGTTDALSKVDVFSSAVNSDVQRWMATDGSRLGRFTETSGGAGWFEVDNASGVAQWLLRGDGGSSYTNSGNFGVGTTTPNHLLTVGAQETPVGTAARLGIYNAGNGYMIFRDATNDIETALGTSTSGNVGYTGTFTNHDFRIILNNSTWALTAQASTGNIGIGTTNPSALLSVGTGSPFQVNGSGQVTSVGISNTSGITSSGTTTLSDFSANGGLLYTNGSGVVAQTAIGTLGECLLSSGGGAPTWGACGAGSGSSNWRLANGSLSPINDTVDLLIGSAATTSAKFAVLNVNGARGTQTASISGNIVLDSAGSIQTTSDQTLTIGGNTTGNIIINDTSTHWLGIGTTVPVTDVTIVGGMNSSGGAISFNNNSNFAVDIGTGTSTGAIGIGTGASTQTIAVGNGAGAKTVSLGSNNTTSTTTILSGSGAVNINASNNQPTNIGTGTSTGLVTIGGTGTQTISIGNGAAVKTVNLGSATSTSTTTIRSGSGGINLNASNNQPTNIGTGTTTGAVTLGGTGTQTIALGNGAGVKTVNLGSSNTTSTTTILSGSNGVNINANNNQPTNIGTGTTTGTVTLGGTGTQTLAIGNGAGVKTVNVGSSNTTSTTTLLSGSGGLNLNVNNNQVTNIGTGTTTSTVTLGGNANNVVINSSTWDISGAGVASGLTGITSSGTITFSGLSVAGGLVYTDGSGVLASLAGSSGQCLISGGASAPTWGACDSAALASKWNISNGAYSQINTTADLLIGGTASTSAKFAFLNVNSGIPTASISGTTSGAALTLNGEGTIATSNNRSLILNPTGGNVGIGTTTAAQALDLVGSMRLQDTSTSTTGVIYKGANRFIHNFAHPTGNTQVPVGSNTFVGVNSGNFTTGSTATSTTHGSYNTGLGVSSLTALTTGYQNTASGTYAMQNTNTGYGNAAYGSYALQTNQTGFNNTAIGNAALIVATNSNNAALGNYALGATTTGANNVGVGAYSLMGNTGGANNIGIGVNAGRYLADGTTANTSSGTSLFIGEDSKALSASNTNQIVIGYGATGLGTNTVVLGNDSITTTALKGSVGIGTTVASSKLTVAGTFLVDGSSADVSVDSSGNFFALGSAVFGSGGGLDGTLRVNEASASRVKLNINNDNAVGGGSRSTQLAFMANGSNRFTIGSDWLTNNTKDFYIEDGSLAGGGLRMYFDSYGRIGMGTDTSLISTLQLERDSGGNATLLINELGSGDLITASASGTTRFRVDNSGQVYAAKFFDSANNSYFLDPAAGGNGLVLAGDISLDSGGTIASTGNNNVIIDAGSGTVLIGATGTGKLDAGTIDPPYWIDGVGYATYAPSMIGLKEEMSEVVTLQPSSVPGLYKYEVDFANLNRETQMNLWLYSRIIDLDQAMNNLGVLVSARGDAKVAYKKDPSARKVIIYGNEPTEVTFRLTAPRYDHTAHGTKRTNQDGRGMQPTTANQPAGVPTINDNDLASALTTAPNWTLSTLGELNLVRQNNQVFAVATPQGSVITNLAAYAQAVVGTFRAGFISAQEVVTTRLAATTRVETPVTQTDLISPLTGNDLTIGLKTASNGQPAGKLQVKNDADQVVASIDGEGNATLAGTLLTQEITTASLSAQTIDGASARISQLEANMAQLAQIKATTAEIVTATISGTLYADDIYQFQDKVASAFQEPSFLSQLLGQVPQASSSTSLATLTNITDDLPFLATGSGSLNKSLADLNLGQEDVVLGSAATFINEYFELNGSGYIADSLGIGNTLLVGQGTTIRDGVYEYVSSTDPNATLLQIQPSGRGSINLLAGLMTLSDNGQVTVAGDLEVAGKVKTETLLTNLISASDFTNPLQVQVAKAATDSAEVKESRFEIINELGTPVATISARGRAAFAGGLAVGSEDISATEGPVTTSKTSGKAKVTTGSNEVVIKASALSAESLVYVTPVGSTGNQVLFVKSQTADNPATSENEAQFVVGFDTAQTQDVQFNWWIVN